MLDGTTGQNALSQAREFGEVANLTGIILTKMDGTAKGGIAVAIQSELNVPVKYIGVGETIEDLQKFRADEFVNALFDIENEESAEAENVGASESDTSVIEESIEDVSEDESDTNVISETVEEVTEEVTEVEDVTNVINETDDTADEKIGEDEESTGEEKPKKKKWLFW